MGLWNNIPEKLKVTLYKYKVKLPKSGLGHPLPGKQIYLTLVLEPLPPPPT